MVISIQAAIYIDDYKINFSFSDGTNKTIDFEKFLKNSKNKMTIKFLDKESFK